MTLSNFSCNLPNDGYFIARPDSLGSSEEEVEKAERGEVDVERLNFIRVSFQEAMTLLQIAMPWGSA